MFQRTIASLFAILSLSACAAMPPPAASAPPAADAVATDRATPPPTATGKGMVSAADPRAAEAGAEVLRQGGSATDAAIATMLALNVVEPQSSGIGGGGFYLHGAPDGSVESLDGRETAPAGADADWFLDTDGKPLGFREAVMSGLSVGVPGNLALAAKAHRRHGKLPWADLFAPAIRLARGGWVLTERGRTFLTMRPDTASFDPAAKALFFDAAGAPLPVGTRLHNPAFAKTLEMLAKDGPTRFYGGEMAQNIAAKVKAAMPHGGAMTPQDIAAYRAKERQPVCGTYRLYRICGMGPPSSGATTVLAIMGMLEPFDLGSMTAESTRFWHLFAEAQRLAYADRELYLADTDFIDVPIAGLIEPGYLKARARMISPQTTMARVDAGTPPGSNPDQASGFGPQEHGTSHFVVVDGDGNAVSYTSTIESAFGSGLMVGGFYLNNELTDFSFVPEQDGRPVANRVQGGKRPRSSMSPTLVYDRQGKLVLAVGAAGGATIPVQVARALIGFIDWHLPIDRALALPVLYSPGDTVIVEQGTSLEAMIPALKALGHDQVIARSLPIKTNAIAVTGGTFAGAADPRSEGRAVSQ